MQIVTWAHDLWFVLIEGEQICIFSVWNRQHGGAVANIAAWWLLKPGFDPAHGVSPCGPVFPLGFPVSTHSPKNKQVGMSSVCPLISCPHYILNLGIEVSNCKWVQMNIHKVLPYIPYIHYWLFTLGLSEFSFSRYNLIIPRFQFITIKPAAVSKETYHRSWPALSLTASIKNAHVFVYNVGGGGGGFWGEGVFNIIYTCLNYKELWQSARNQMETTFITLIMYSFALLSHVMSGNLIDSQVNMQYMHRRTNIKRYLLTLFYWLSKTIYHLNIK